MATTRLDEAGVSLSFSDNVEKFAELFPTYVHIHNSFCNGYVSKHGQANAPDY